MRPPSKSHGKSETSACVCCLLTAALVTLTSPSLMAATITKNNNNDALNLGTSWVGGAVPGAVDTAQWDATVGNPANCTNVLAGDLTWNGLTILNPAAPVEIGGANTLTFTSLDMSGATVDLTLNCNVNVEGSPTWPIAAGRTLNIGDLMGGSGSIRQQGGTLRLLPGLGALPDPMIFSMTNSSLLDLGGNSQTLASFLPPWNGATGSVSNGSLTLSLANADYDAKTQGNNSTEDLTGLANFTVNNTNRIFNFNCGNTGAGGINIYMYLASTNLFAVKDLNVGGYGYVSSGTSPFSYMYLGENTKINANNLNVGGYRAWGVMKFRSGLNNPTLKLRAPNGTSRLPNWKIGYYSSGSQSGGGTVDLTGGTLDCVVGTLVVGQHTPNASSSTTGTLIIDGAASSLEVQTGATLADKTASSGSPTITGTISQREGSVKIATLTLGNNLGTASGVTIKAAYQMSGGTLRAQTIRPGTFGPTENTNSFRTFFWTNGVIQNFSATTALTVQEQLLISAPGSGNRYLRADSGVTNTILAPLRQTSGASPIVKDGEGGLSLQGSGDNGYLGLNVSNGVVYLEKTSDSTVHAVGSGLTLNGGMAVLGGSGGDQIYDGNVVTINSGAFDVNGQAETVAGLVGGGGVVTNGGYTPGTLTLNLPSGVGAYGGEFAGDWNLTKSGAGTFIITGTDNRIGGANDVSGTLLVSNSVAGAMNYAGNTTVQSGGVLVFNTPGTVTLTGTLSGAGSLRQNGTGVLVVGNDTHTGATLVTAGTLQVAPGVSALGGSSINVSSGALLDLSPAGFLALSAQSLSGAGKIKGDFFLGSGALLAGTLTVTNGSITSGDSSTNAPGGLRQAGTLNVQGNYTCGYNSYLVYDLAAATTVGGGVNDLMVIGGNLDLSQPCTLIVNGTPQTGTYTLATFGSFTGNAANLTVVGSPRITFAPRRSGNSLLLDVTGSVANLVWQGDGAGNAWDNSLGLLWLNTGTSAADKFYPSDNTLFDDSTANLTVSVNDTVFPSSVVVNATNNFTFAGFGAIGGDAALTKNNTGTLTIQNNNSFTGPVGINGGTVSVAGVAASGPQPLGTGTALNLNGGAFQYTGPAVGVGEFNRDINLGANGGIIDQQSSAGIYFFVTNRISGSGSLTKIGNQQLILGDGAGGTGSNTYAGGTFINAGNLQIRNAAALGTNSVWISTNGSLAADGGFAGIISNNIVLRGGNLAGGPANYTYGGRVTLETGGSTVGSSYGAILAGLVTGGAPLQKVGSGTVTLASSSNDYTGGTLISAGTLQLGTNGTTGWIPAQPPGQVLTNNGTLAFNRADTNTFAETITGTGGLNHNGSGMTVLTGSNDFTGTVRVNGGVLRAAANFVTGQGAVVITGGNTYAPLELTGGITLANTFTLNMHNLHQPHIRNLSGTNTLNGLIALMTGGTYWDIFSDGGYLVINSTIGGTNFADTWRTLCLNGSAGGRLNGVIDPAAAGASGNINLQVMGGTWTLSTNNLYGGSNFVDAGATLLVANSDQTIPGSATGSGAVVVSGTLGGNGYVDGPVTVTNSGTLAPGFDGIGTLTLNNHLAQYGNLFFKLNKSLTQSNDFVAVVGGVTNFAAGTLSVTNLGPALAAGDKFKLFSQPVLGGDLLTVTGGGSGVTWTNLLAVDGSISVLSAAPTVNTHPFVVSASVSGGSLNLSWPPDRLGWKVQIQTNNLAKGLGTNWITIPESASVTNYSLPINRANPSVFLRMTY